MCAGSVIIHWCAIKRTPIVMAKHGGSCVHFFQESPLAGKPRERLFHIHSVNRYQLRTNSFTRLRSCDK